MTQYSDWQQSVDGPDETEDDDRPILSDDEIEMLRSQAEESNDYNLLGLFRWIDELMGRNEALCAALPSDPMDYEDDFEPEF